MRIPAQQNTEIVEPSNNPLKLDAIDEKYGNRCFVFPDVVQENVLNVLRFFRSHGSSPTPFLEPSRPVHAEALGRDPELLQSKWARAGESQAPHKEKQGRTIGEDKARLATEKLYRGRSVAEQNRNATAVVCALHIGAGVADEPDALA